MRVHRVGLVRGLVLGGLVLGGLGSVGIYLGCRGSVEVDNVETPQCTAGDDKDGDQYGKGCKAGPDCDDNNPLVHPYAPEQCNGRDDNCDGQLDEGLPKNPCGTCDPNCGWVGKEAAFPMDPAKDPNVRESGGVTLDPNGDLKLDGKRVDFHYLWVANTYDPAGQKSCDDRPRGDPRCRGTISKVDTVRLKEVARYFTVTCKSKEGAQGCLDANGQRIARDHNHTPSRTAVDYNFDVWVANRSVHGGQPSATKIANDPADCIDRNKNGKIDTSKDQNDDGKISLDCNGDGKADDGATVCGGALAGKPPEFLGDDDECILFTTNYAEDNDLGRSICLDGGKANVGASAAWVGTFNREKNRRGANLFYKINGESGKIEASVTMPAGHKSYGCMADSNHIIWSTDIYGSLAFLSTITNQAGPLLKAPWVPKAGREYHHYGITVDGDQRVWLGGYHSSWVLRYAPKRDNFDALSKGVWTRIDVPDGWVTRGIAADNRGKVWVAIESGAILRLEQSIPDGVHDMTGVKEGKDYWPIAAREVIGAGIDLAGHIWGVGKDNDTAARLDVDAQGNVVTPATGNTNKVTLGRNPYTYSDFTGYGLMTFLRPNGRYVYHHQPCKAGEKAIWQSVTWNATAPAGTSVSVRVRTGDSEASMGPWSAPFTSSPAFFGPGSPRAISPNPSAVMHVEVNLASQIKDVTPIVHDYTVGFVCVAKTG
ncbi:MAG: putative metal-binding motif-containing protein [Deltaproteobacteria bacterium]|nr:putative metal-binding motif-containing protein [Deltaproteobacteria bacterium]